MHYTINDGSTKIESDKPITKEYLEERYEKIQHYFKTEYNELNKKVNRDNGILKDMGISMHGWKQRDSWGIVKIDGEYLEIDGDEFKKHHDIYYHSPEGARDRAINFNNTSTNKFERDSKTEVNNESGQKYVEEKSFYVAGNEFEKHYYMNVNIRAEINKEEMTKVVDKEAVNEIPEYIQNSHAFSVYYKELNGIEPSFENAEELEYYAKKDEWRDSHINSLYRRISLAVNLGLIEEGNQTLFPEMYQTDKASYTFKNIENDILSQAVLDSIDQYTAVMEGVMYDVLFGMDENFFQNELNKFAKELQNNPTKYPSTNSEFIFTGDINIDENSTDEYKGFITNTLIDYIEKQKDDYVSGNHPIKDPYRTDWSVAHSFDVISNNLKESLTVV